MQLVQLLSNDRVACHANASSKKRLLELASELLASADTRLTQKQIFECLIAREKLGSTALNHGVAIPHGRFQTGGEAIAAFVQLQQGVDYDAADNEPVDMVFALLVPEENAQDHIHILAAVAELFSSQAMRDKLRQAGDVSEIFDILASAQR